MQKRRKIMPISERNGKWYWGSKGPFNSRKKAEEVAQAAHASGYEKLLKEGDGGAGLDGLSGVVFTSENAGIFTPTHGGSKTTRKERKHIKREHDEKRKKLLGKQKKSGVERLEQFVKEGSPIKKAVNKRSDGMPQGDVAHNPQNNLIQVDYRKLGEDREIGKDNEPNSSMSGLDSRMDASTHATKPQDEDPSITTKSVPNKPDWGTNKAYVQKAGVASFANIGQQPNQNTESHDISTEPQAKYIERGKAVWDKKNDYQDIKMNDVTRRVKKYQEDDEADVEQPLGVASAAKSQIQSMEKQWGSGSERGEYKRSEDGDEIPPDKDEVLEEAESAKVIEALQRLQARKKGYVEKGETHPLFLAMMDDIDE